MAQSVICTSETINKYFFKKSIQHKMAQNQTKTERT